MQTPPLSFSVFYPRFGEFATLFFRFRPEGFRHGKHCFQGQFAELPVIGHNAVDLILHIADLGIDGGAEALFDTGQNFFQVEFSDRLIQLLQVFKAAVTGCIVGIEQMSLRLVGSAAEFRENQGLFAVALQFHLPEIHMAAVHITFFPAEPAGSAVNERGIIQGS